MTGSSEFTITIETQVQNRLSFASKKKPSKDTNNTERPMAKRAPWVAKAVCLTTKTSVLFPLLGLKFGKFLSLFRSA